MVGSGSSLFGIPAEGGQGAAESRSTFDPRMLSDPLPDGGQPGRRPLDALLPFLKRKEDRSWRKKLEKEIEAWWKGVDKRARQKADPHQSRNCCSGSCRPGCRDNVIVSADSGTSANWFARALRFRRGICRASLSGTLADDVPGRCRTRRPPSSPIRTGRRSRFVGDGAMQMLGINALITIAKYWRLWSNPTCIIAVPEQLAT